MADNALIIGHRISEWCGHGPVLEQDIALTNIALDHVGQSRMYYQLAADMEEGATEDTYAYTRDTREFKNLLLLEQENKDFGYTIARSFYYDIFHLLLLEQLMQCEHKGLSEIAAQAIKEVKYHVRFSSDWVKRLGDGTEESHNRIQKGLDSWYMYVGEMFKPSEADQYMKTKYGLDIESLEQKWHRNVERVLGEATLKNPEVKHFQEGGKTGLHTEKHGFILAELQFMQRMYPNMTW